MKIGRTAIGVMAAYLAFGQGDTVFRVQTRLVEVYATVRDHNGRYLDGLPQDRFQIKDNGQVQPVVAFESNTAQLSCAILLDTTGSMAAALPIVKNSVMRMIDDLTADDKVAVYGFSVGLKRLQDFTTDKAAAKTTDKAAPKAAAAKSAAAKAAPKAAAKAAPKASAEKVAPKKAAAPKKKAE